MNVAKRMAMERRRVAEVASGLWVHLFDGKRHGLFVRTTADNRIFDCTFADGVGTEMVERTGIFSPSSDHPPDSLTISSPSHRPLPLPSSSFPLFLFSLSSSSFLSIFFGSVFGVGAVQSIAPAQSGSAPDAIDSDPRSAPHDG